MADKKNITPPEIYNPPRKKHLFRPWVVNEDDSEVRGGSRAHALRSIVDAIHYCYNMVPFVWFSKNFGGYSGTTSDYPTSRWKFKDYLNQAGVIEHRFIFKRPTTGGGNKGYAVHGSNADWYNANNKVQTIFDNIDKNHIDEIIVDKYTTGRGSSSSADAIKEDGLSIYNGIQITGMIVQESIKKKIDVEDDDYIPIEMVEKGDRITDVAEEIRLALENLHKHRRPAGFWWSTIGPDSGQAAPGDGTSATTTSTSLSNIFDSSASRDENTAGFQCDVYRGGVGRLDVSSGYGVFGKQVRMKVYVYGKATTEDGTCRVVGPTHVSSNHCDLSWTAGAGASWQTDYIILNSSANPATVNTETQNKVDILFKTDAAGGKMQIFAACGIIDPDE